MENRFRIRATLAGLALAGILINAGACGDGSAGDGSGTAGEAKGSSAASPRPGAGHETSVEPGKSRPGGNAPSADGVAAATYVGGAVCAGCHTTEARLWRGSHHDLAMQEPTEATVLGNFDDASFTYAGVTSTFFRRDGDFFVRTDNADGKLTEYRIAYTFGFDPLQQYLIEFPRGYIQALNVCWDTRPAAEGGQRWFHLYPGDEVTHDDPLHWTGGYQNWNYMCAECHSTNLQRNYDFRDDAYSTTWSEIDVSCEACHGPGSAHLEWAASYALGEGDEAGGPGDDAGDSASEASAEAHSAAVRGGEAATGGSSLKGLTVSLANDGVWSFDDDTGTAHRTRPPASRIQIDTCGRCHSRHTPVTEDYRHGRPLADDYRIALLDEALYHADGQILDEVYVYGSFLQSRMYHQGVTCSDCHAPHSGRLRAEGDLVCGQCHLPARFATSEHHFHKEGTAGASCLDCHMQARNYMVVDPRRDHSFRVPRPDLSLKLGSPNACNDCHKDRPVEWAAEKVNGWYGPQRGQEFHYGEALHAGRSRLTEGGALLARVVADGEQPGIARATALSLLGGYPGPQTWRAVEQARQDSDPLVRAAAVSAAEVADVETRVRIAYPALTDPVRTVRLEAARVLATVPAGSLTAEQRAPLTQGLDEYRQAQHVNADRAEAHVNLGALQAQLGDVAQAEESYRIALRLNDGFLPTYINLADLYRVQNRDEEGEQLLRRALKIDSTDAGLHHALGLALVRRGRLPEAVEALRQAAEMDPGEPRYSYVYGVALHSGGRLEEALSVLAEAHRLHPGDRNLLLALTTMNRDAGDLTSALGYARKLRRLSPGEPQIQELIRQLEAAAAGDA